MSETISIEQVRVEIAQVLRHKVLHSDKPYEASIYTEDRLFDAQHFAAFLPNKIVGAASIYQCSLPPETSKTTNAWRLRAIAVLPEHQNCGFGAALLHQCVDFIKIQNGALLWCETPAAAIGFFQKANFEIINDKCAARDEMANFLMRRAI